MFAKVCGSERKEGANAVPNVLELVSDVQTAGRHFSRNND